MHLDLGTAEALASPADVIFCCAPQQVRGIEGVSDMVINNAAHHRFELEVSGHLAASYYKRDGDVITFEHTEVPAELGGQGIGSRLIKDALDQARRNRWKVVAQCPFVKAYIEKHAEYQALLKA